MRMTLMIIGLLLVVIILSSCGKMDKSMASLTGHSTKCIDGVNYLQFSSGATVKYNQDGTISTC